MKNWIKLEKKELRFGEKRINEIGIFGGRKVLGKDIIRLWPDIATAANIIFSRAPPCRTFPRFEAAEAVAAEKFLSTTRYSLNSLQFQSCNNSEIIYNIIFKKVQYFVSDYNIIFLLEIVIFNIWMEI